MAKITEKAFAKGSALPELKKDTLRLYNMRFCSYANRTQLVLAHKNIPHETININLRQKPDWFLERTPLGLVPVLECNDKIVYESAICDDYLDEVYPENKLTPSDPYVKARHKMMMEHFAKAFIAHFTLRKASDEDFQTILEDQHKVLDMFEKTLDGKFFGGDKPAMLDLHIWPVFERQDALKQLREKEVFPTNRFPKLSRWKANMLEIPAVKATMHSTETHLKYMKTIVAGQTDYDIGLE